MNSLFIENEIRHLLIQHHRTDFVASTLIEYFEKNEHWTKEDLHSFAVFLLHCGFYVTIVELIGRLLPKHKDKIPWQIFIEGLGLSKAHLTDETLENLLQLLRVENAITEGCQSSALDNALPQLREHRNQLILREKNDFENIRQEQIDLIGTYRAQQLFAKEKALIERLQKKYPGDLDILAEEKKFKERHAFEIFNRKSKIPHKKKKNESIEKLEEQQDLELLRSQYLDSVEIKEENLETLTQLVHSAYLAENYQIADELLYALKSNLSNLPTSLLWLEMEVFLKLEKYLEILNALSLIEVKENQNSDVFLATSFLRAKAYWGLGQREKAIEILEGISQLNPGYRSCETLLESWKGQL